MSNHSFFYLDTILLVFETLYYIMAVSICILFVFMHFALYYSQLLLFSRIEYNKVRESN